MIKMSLFGSQVLLTMDFECRSRPVNNYVNIRLGVPKSQINPYDFLVGLSKEYCSSFMDEETAKKPAGVPVLCPTFRFPAMQVGLEAENLCNKLLLQEITKPWGSSTDLCAHQHPGAFFAAIRWRVQCNIVGHADVSLLSSVKTALIS